MFGLEAAAWGSSAKLNFVVQKCKTSVRLSHWIKLLWLLCDLSLRNPGTLLGESSWSVLGIKDNNKTRHFSSQAQKDLRHLEAICICCFLNKFIFFQDLSCGKIRNSPSLLPLPPPFPQTALIPSKNENNGQKFMLSLSSAKEEWNFGPVWVTLISFQESYT